TSIEKSEQLAEMLRQEGWEQHDFSDPNAFAALYTGDEGAKKTKVFAVLNARYHEQEAYIVSQAGVPGAITIATNMAGRGTDIQLGGNADMRIFGSDKLDGMLQKLGLKENEAIVHPWINKALEKAQQKVEARNFDLRKNILKFDNVMNDQRKVIFDQRIELMKDENVAGTIA